MKSAEMYPEYQGEPGNIQFLTRTEHLEAHDGNWQNPTNWYYNPVTKEKFDFGDPVESLEIAGVAIGGVAKAISSIKGSGSGKTRSTTSASGNSSVAEKVADIVEKASRSLPSENDVTGHKQRYHTKNGVVWKDKAPYHRGGK